MLSRIAPLAFAVLVASGLEMLLPAAAAAEPNRCVVAARQAEQALHIPAGLLEAIAYAESAEHGLPHPFVITVNDGSAAGQRPIFWPDSFAAARRMLYDTQGRVRKNLDVGCFQLSLAWQANRLPTPDVALDPDYSAHYEGLLLLENYARCKAPGRWSCAVGALNSSRPAIRLAYTCSVARNWARITKTALAPAVQKRCSEK